MVAAQAKPYIVLSGYNNDKCTGSTPEMVMSYKSGQCYTVGKASLFLGSAYERSHIA